MAWPRFNKLAAKVRPTPWTITGPPARQSSFLLHPLSNEGSHLRPWAGRVDAYLSHLQSTAESPEGPLLKHAEW